MGRTVCTEPQCLYKVCTLPTSVPVQGVHFTYLSACKRCALYLPQCLYKVCTFTYLYMHLLVISHEKSTLSLTLALDGMGGQRLASGASPTGKGPGTHCTGVSVSPRASLDGCEIFSPPPEFEPQTFQPVRSRCTDI